MTSRAEAAVCVALSIVIVACCACAQADDGDEDGDATSNRPSLPTSVTTAGAGETATLDGERYVADRTLPASALSAERLESAGEAEGGGTTITLAKARSDDVEPWERVSAASDGWRVWQPAAVRHVRDEAGAGATISEAELTDFPDACLGAAHPGEVCAAVITPGYRVIIEQDGVRTEYRVDRAGGQVRKVP